jgi:prefoldin subunit 5
LNETIEDLQANVAELTYSTKALKRDLASARQQLKEVETSACDSTASLTINHQKEVDHLNVAHSELESRLGNMLG